MRTAARRRPASTVVAGAIDDAIAAGDERGAVAVGDGELVAGARLDDGHGFELENAR